MSQSGQYGGQYTGQGGGQYGGQGGGQYGGQGGGQYGGQGGGQYRGQGGGGQYTGQGPRPPRSRVLPNVLSLVLSLVLTPVGMVVLALGTERSYRVVVTASDVDPVAALLVVAGAALLLVVVLLAASGPAGPLVAGLLFGTAPGLFFLVAPITAIRTSFDLPVPRELSSGLQTFGVVGGFGLVAVALVGAALVSALASRRGRRSATR